MKSRINAMKSYLNKLSISTQMVFDYITQTNVKCLDTKDLISRGISAKQIAAGVSVLVRKGLIDKSPFTNSHKNYLLDKSAFDELSLHKVMVRRPLRRR